MSKQKEIFLAREGDSWFDRNVVMTSRRDFFPELEILVPYLIGNNKIGSVENFEFLEVGCGGGERTNFICQMTKGSGVGIDPSSRAIEFARSKYQKTNLNFLVGTADNLPLCNESVDLVYFGFCLYLVDRDLVQQCVEDSLRVLKPHGKLLLLDFDPVKPYSTSYSHNPQVRTFKDNYEKYFIEKGFHITAKISQRENGEIGFEQNPQKRVATFLLSR